MTIEFVDVTRLEDLHVFDLIDEGVYINRITIGDRSYAEAMAAVAVATWVPVDAAGNCLLNTEWTWVRDITSSDLPLRVVRGPLQPPIQCELDITPCERCPRATRLDTDG